MADFMSLLQATAPPPRNFGDILGEVGSAVAGQLGGGPPVGQQLLQGRQVRNQEQQFRSNQLLQIGQMVQEQAKLEAAKGDRNAKNFHEIADMFGKNIDEASRNEYYGEFAMAAQGYEGNRKMLTVIGGKIAENYEAPSKLETDTIKSYNDEGEQVTELVTYKEDGTITRRNLIGKGAPTVYQPTTDRVLNRKMIGDEAATRNVVDSANRLIKLVQDEPAVLSVAGGGVARMVGELRAEAQAFAQVIGVQDKVNLDPSIIDPALKRLGISRSVLKSEIVGIAYAAALANGQKGQSVSDKDVVRQLEQVGANLSDPEAFIAVIDNFARNNVGKFQNRQMATLKINDRSDPRIKTLESFGFKEIETGGNGSGASALPSNKAADFTPEELDAMSVDELLSLE